MHFWRVVNEVLKQSDIVLEVVDARFPDKGRNEEIEGKLRSMKKDFMHNLFITKLYFFRLILCDIRHQNQILL